MTRDDNGNQPPGARYSRNGRGVPPEPFVTYTILTVAVVWAVGCKLAALYGWFGFDFASYSGLTDALAFGPELSQGEWWRLFSAWWVHAPLLATEDFLHAISQLVALALIGPRLEEAWGRARFAGCLAVSAVLGASLGFAFAPWPGQAGLGPAIAGLVGAACAASVAKPRGFKAPERRELVRTLVEWGLLTIAFFAFSRREVISGPFGSWSALVGGAAAGAALVLANSGGSRLVWLALALVVLGGAAGTAWRVTELRRIFPEPPLDRRTYARIYYEGAWHAAESLIAERKTLFEGGLQPSESAALLENRAALDRALTEIKAAAGRYEDAAALHAALWEELGGATALARVEEMIESVRTINEPLGVEQDLWDSVYEGFLDTLLLPGADLAVQERGPDKVLTLLLLVSDETRPSTLRKLSERRALVEAVHGWRP